MSATGRQPSFLCSLLSGAVAGPSVDIALYPLDTIKTRLQSAGGFIKAGGFTGVYAGLGAGAIGSAPGSMFFFSTYEGVKKVMGSRCAFALRAGPLYPPTPPPPFSRARAHSLFSSPPAAAQWRDTDRTHSSGLLRRSDGLPRASPYRKRQAEASGRHSFINSRLRESDHEGGWLRRLLSRMCAPPSPPPSL